MKKKAALFLYAVMGGLCIGLGGTVFLRLKDAFPGGNVVGAVLFSIGLFTICTHGYALYTGKVCYVFQNKPGYVLDVILIWLGNFVGCTAMGGLERCTTLAPALSDAARALVEAKLASPLLSLFLLGCVCNVFIFISVSGYAKNPHELGKYLALILGVTVFILCGTEHSVADMYYWAVSGVLVENPGESLLRLAVITLGNAVGGVIFPLAEQLYAKLTG